ncbi:hypothetical protein CYMTET_55127 [Cymbomonas tetramitiformis]|uniref:Uncharacterized protein n=1 Tax=Cymbomonas tetramitiformis TaxID=36881 RepID=A0AAE0EN88_9CHLO|nr:hypothetical protein CYMTET_55127 [Cymbomonas tetramitiformis]
MNYIEHVDDAESIGDLSIDSDESDDDDLHSSELIINEEAVSVETANAVVADLQPSVIEEAVSAETANAVVADLQPTVSEEAVSAETANAVVADLQPTVSGEVAPVETANAVVADLQPTVSEEAVPVETANAVVADLQPTVSGEAVPAETANAVSLSSLRRVVGFYEGVRSVIMNVYDRPPISAEILPICTHELNREVKLYSIGKVRNILEDRPDYVEVTWKPDHVAQHLLIEPKDTHFALPNNTYAFQLYQQDGGLLSFENAYRRGPKDGVFKVVRYTPNEMSTAKFEQMDIFNEDVETQLQNNRPMQSTRKSPYECKKLNTKQLSRDETEVKKMYRDDPKGRFIDDHHIYRCYYARSHARTETITDYPYVYFGMDRVEEQETKLAKSTFFKFSVLMENESEQS